MAKQIKFSHEAASARSSRTEAADSAMLTCSAVEAASDARNLRKELHA